MSGAGEGASRARPTRGSHDVVRYDGVDAATLAARLDLPRVVLLGETTSTLDVAHAVAEAGAPGGTLVLADRQSAGRGRQGRAWSSPSGRGVWLTLVERELDARAVPVLSLRAGLALAPALDALAGETVSLKWPNDLQVGMRKLGGILIEARWRDDRLEWVAVGVGINVAAPPADDVPNAAALADGVSRLDVLEAIVSPLRAAARRPGLLAAGELEAFAARDVGRGRRCRTPLAGRYAGVGADGALLVAADEAASPRALHSGSLTFEGELP